MDNCYEAPEVLKLGEAQDVIGDQKVPASTIENLGVPFMTDAPTLDDFDE
jgi:hypothetical protein